MITPPPIKIRVQDENGNLQSEWINHFTDIYLGIAATQNSGTTALRPIKNLYIGRTYFDITLGYLISIKQVKPTVIWVNGAGTAV